MNRLTKKNCTVNVKQFGKKVDKKKVEFITKVSFVLAHEIYVLLLPEAIRQNMTFRALYMWLVVELISAKTIIIRQFNRI